MSKRNHASVQHLPSGKPAIQARESPPIPFPTKAGIELHCPFCDDHHTLAPDKESPCGTKIEVMAVQQVISARLSKEQGIICLKCHKPGGEMVHYRNGYIHLENCSPQVKFLQDEPKYSVAAKLVYSLHPRIRGLVERLTGRVDQVLEIDELGEKTGKVRGYFFWRNNAKHSNAPAR